MQLIAPDILADMCGMSVGLTVSGLGIGLALWLFGWRTHRFWVVLVTTVLGGLLGLYEAEAFRTEPLVAALLVALTAGMLALALVRLLAFAAAGIAGLVAIQSFFPALDQALIAFLMCGLVGLFLFRLSLMILTSLAGTILIGYCGLCLLNHYGAMEAVAWSEQGSVLMNWIVGLLTLLGTAFQFVLDRRGYRKDKKSKSRDDTLEKILAFGKSYRRAG